MRKFIENALLKYPQQLISAAVLIIAIGIALAIVFLSAPQQITKTQAAFTYDCGRGGYFFCGYQWHWKCAQPCGTIPSNCTPDQAERSACNGVGRQRWCGLNPGEVTCIPTNWSLGSGGCCVGYCDRITHGSCFAHCVGPGDPNYSNCSNGKRKSPPPLPHPHPPPPPPHLASVGGRAYDVTTSKGVTGIVFHYCRPSHPEQNMAVSDADGNYSVILANGAGFCVEPDLQTIPSGYGSPDPANYENQQVGTTCSFGSCNNFDFKFNGLPGPKHNACVNNACVSVSGSGSNQCSSNTDCIPPPQPNIAQPSISANPSVINPGQFSKLTWSCSGADSGSIDQGIGTVCSSPASCAAGGSVTSSPTSTTTYTLTCSNARGNVSASAKVYVMHIQEVNPGQ